MEIEDSRTAGETDTWRPVVRALTHRQGSLMSLMKRGESWALRTSGEVLQDTAMKHTLRMLSTSPTCYQSRAQKTLVSTRQTKATQI